jgi:hypothetical protein
MMSSGILVAVAAICLTGCSFFSPAVQTVGSGQGFHERQFPLDTEYISVGTPGQEQYRVFDPNTDELANAEQAASAFCERHGKAINLLEITTFAPSRSLLDLLCVLCTYPGPAAEIIFECI